MGCDSLSPHVVVTQLDYMSCKKERTKVDNTEITCSVEEPGQYFTLSLP